MDFTVEEMNNAAKVISFRRRTRYVACIELVLFGCGMGLFLLPGEKENARFMSLALLAAIYMGLDGIWNILLPSLTAYVREVISYFVFVVYLATSKENFLMLEKLPDYFWWGMIAALSLWVVLFVVDILNWRRRFAGEAALRPSKEAVNWVKDVVRKMNKYEANATNLLRFNVLGGRLRGRLFEDRAVFANRAGTQMHVATKDEVECSTIGKRVTKGRISVKLRVGTWQENARTTSEFIKLYEDWKGSGEE